MNTPHGPHDDLAERYLRGELDAEELAAFEQSLRDDPAARARFRRAARLDANLRSLAARGESELAAWARATPGSGERATDARPWRERWFGWLRWSALVTLAAGMAVGLCGASVAGAYLAQPAHRAVPLLSESFESGTESGTAGIPESPGKWSGDYAEIIRPQQDVQPATGDRMLRFLRADHKGKFADSGYIGDMFRMLDMRDVRLGVANGDSVVEVSASFNAAAFPRSEQYYCGVAIYSFERIVPGVLTDATAPLPHGLNSHAMSQRTVILDRDPATWQRVAAELRLPHEAKYILVHLFVARFQPAGAEPAVRFPGHFADDVTVSLVRSSGRR